MQKKKIMEIFEPSSTDNTMNMVLNTKCPACYLDGSMNGFLTISTMLNNIILINMHRKWTHKTLASGASFSPNNRAHTHLTFGDGRAVAPSDLCAETRAHTQFSIYCLFNSQFTIRTGFFFLVLSDVFKCEAMAAMMSVALLNVTDASFSYKLISRYYYGSLASYARTFACDLCHRLELKFYNTIKLGFRSIRSRILTSSLVDFIFIFPIKMHQSTH